MTSIGGIFVTLSALGLGLTMAEHYEGFSTFGKVAQYSYVAFFSLGIGPVTWVYSTEIFPLKFRAQGLSFWVVVNKIMNVVVLMGFVRCIGEIFLGGAFFMFAGISVLAGFFFYFFLPETKGGDLWKRWKCFFRRKTRLEIMILEMKLQMVLECSQKKDE